MATIHNLGCVLVPRGDFGLAWLAKKMSSNAFAHNWQTFLHCPKILHSLRKQLRSVLFFCSMVKKKIGMPHEFLVLERCHSASPKSIFCWWLFNSLGAIARLSKIVQNMDTTPQFLHLFCAQTNADFSGKNEKYFWFSVETFFKIKCTPFDRECKHIWFWNAKTMSVWCNSFLEELWKTWSGQPKKNGTNL